MINITKKELKKQSIKFRTKANLLINCNYQDCDNRIKRFINTVDEIEIINDYISDCCNSAQLDYDFASEVMEVANSYGNAVFDRPSNTEEEVAFTYLLLKYFAEDSTKYVNCARGYSHSSKYQDHVKEFHNRVVYPFVQEIENYLNEISIEMGFDEEEKFMINVSGGQVNIAKDNANINATQIHNINYTLLDELVNNIKSELTDDISAELKNDINDYIEAINEEMHKHKPKKPILKMAIQGLKDVASSIPKAMELSIGIIKIIEFVETVSKNI